MLDTTTFDTADHTVSFAVNTDPRRSAEDFGDDVWQACADLGDAINKYLSEANISPVEEARLKSVEWLLFTTRRATYLDLDILIYSLKRSIEYVKEFFENVPANAEHEDEPVVV